ncbi:hypothetical protein AAFF_G00121490 [Aldrovandia affinis]|uniref:Uncharacterized protein n=1 Tax=Aldrovandia affinis TaxID=143900 RepID=A0AAD7RRX1_9TELE|nr:hypothetical protein AAFF_G00121490 [Aldrovandia affinis]
MSKLCCVRSLLLFLLVIIWCDYTVMSRRWIGANQLLKNECKCKVMPNNKVRCPKQLSQQSNQVKLDILRCLCKKHLCDLDVNLQRACKKRSGGFPIPLPLA